MSAILGFSEMLGDLGYLVVVEYGILDLPILPNMLCYNISYPYYPSWRNSSEYLYSNRCYNHTQSFTGRFDSKRLLRWADAVGQEQPES